MLARQHLQVDGFRHRLVARIVRVKMIARIKGGLDMGRTIRIAQHRIEIQYAVERAALPDPLHLKSSLS